MMLFTNPSSSENKERKIPLRSLQFSDSQSENPKDVVREQQRLIAQAEAMVKDATTEVQRLRTQCDTELSARQDAFEESLKQKEQETYTRAKKEGWQAGFEEGHKEGRNEGFSTLESLLSQTQMEWEETRRVTTDYLDSINVSLIELIRDIVERLVAQECFQAEKRIESLLTPLLHELWERKEIKIKVHPTQVEGAFQLKEKYELTGYEGRIAILPDSTLQPADIWVETEGEMIDLTLETARDELLQRLKEGVLSA